MVSINRDGYGIKARLWVFEDVEQRLYLRIVQKVIVFLKIKHSNTQLQFEHFPKIWYVLYSCISFKCLSLFYILIYFHNDSSGLKVWFNLNES